MPMTMPSRYNIGLAWVYCTSFFNYSSAIKIVFNFYKVEILHIVTLQSVSQCKLIANYLHLLSLKLPTTCSFFNLQFLNI